tara:strand:- start:2759 stop:4048 length:1290 start_codon:yes stop_codon:yes gene_type:complete
MAVTTTWRIEVGYYDNGTTFSTTDFTSRTLGLTVDHFTDLGVIGTGQAVITLDNNDGALTPGAGGTYSSTSWFERALLIYCDVAGGGSGTAAKVFAGIIDDFQVDDDGITSTVTIAAVDVLQTASRQQVQTGLTSVTQTSPMTAIRTLVDPSESYNDTVMPNFGETANPNGNVSVFLASPSTTRTVKLIQTDLSAGPIGDYLANHVVTCGLTAVWPAGFDDNTGHQQIFVVENAQRTDSRTYQFAENPTGAEMPYRNLERGYALDQLTTAARLERLETGTVETQTSSQAKFGSRLREYVTASDSTVDTAFDAFHWVQRFANPRYSSTRLQVTAAMIEERLPDAQFLKWVDLLTAQYGIYTGATVEFTPAGRPSAITDTTVVIGRTIKASPADTTVTLTLRPSIDYGTFTLDSAALGIIGINRLGGSGTT